MGKIRIHELAKELNITSRDILDFLETKGIKDKKAASSLEEAEASGVRARFKDKGALRKAAGASEKTADASGKAAQAPEKSAGVAEKAKGDSGTGNEAKAASDKSGNGKEAARPAKRKRRLVAVFHPQNASDADTRNLRRPKGMEQGKTNRPGAGTAVNAPGDGRKKENRDRRTLGNDRRSTAQRTAGRRTGKAAGVTPLVRVPRPHPIMRDENIMQKPTGVKTIHDTKKKAAKKEETKPTLQEAVKEETRPAKTQVSQDVTAAAPKTSEKVEATAQGNGKKQEMAKNPKRQNMVTEEKKNHSSRKRPSSRQEALKDQGAGMEEKKGRSRKKQNETREGGRNNARGGRNAGEKGEGKFTGERRRQNQRGQSRKDNALPKALQKPAPRPKEEKKEVITEIRIPEKLTIKELAEAMKLTPATIIKKLFMEGKMMTMNQEISFDEAEEIAMSYDIIAEKEEQVDVIEELLKEDEEDEKDLVPRPPVVAVMGHVDHGKTSLLDAIRHSRVTAREAGGITQNIGAYVVESNGRKIAFLDTPGHEAFTAMRMRGANSTDIAVLVVAADDGVMPQTIEAINHAKAANVEIIVAVNKIDKPSANVDRVKQELTEYGLVAEDWGGQTIFCPVSAKTKEGIDNLLEMILLTADVMELKANPNRNARGLVLEAKLDKGKGPVANVLIQKGTLHVGDYIACGSASGKVRAMMDENSKRVKAAGPSTPVEVLGLSDVPGAGEVLVATDTDKEAKNFAATFVSEEKNKLLEDTKSRMSLDDLFSQIQTGNLKELELIVKADVQGSVEALRQALEKLSNDEVHVRVIHGGVGAITESDITLAAASNAIVIGFNVRPDGPAKALSEQEKVDVRLYRVIYQAIDDIESAMKGMLEPIYEEKIIGHAEVRQLFKASGVGTIAGSYVLDGYIQRGSKVRISREGKQIFEGKLASLKRFKDDVKEVKAGYECGLVVEDFNEIHAGDQVEAAIMVEVPRT